DENDQELTYPYEEVDPLNPPPPTFKSKPDDEIEVENLIEYEDETIRASIHEVGRFYGHETAHALVKKKGKAKEKLYGKLILKLDKVECMKLKKKLEEARFSNTFLHMQNERVEISLYWTRVWAYEFYQEMIHRRVVFEERPNEAINVPIEDEKCPSSETRESSQDPSVDAAIAAERARQANVKNDANGSRPVMGQDAAPAICECTFAGFMKCNPAVFRGVEGAVELPRWFKKTKSVFEISECVKGKKVKFDADTLEGLALTWWKTKVATMGLEKVNQMPWTEMKQSMTAEFYPIEEVRRMEHEL
nr:hypothetical protein [Tanacetum cinerariifolium]